ncbi:transcription termination/antitermination protein NusG [Novipirellula artificiosorum]|uniref:Transcriptional activator RfaH n=1 Tax=Novipirellula artificiosorum TaxID=2528016 RepID=A0A5C6DI90_9BACT|nr:transcription termination/antitermination NusG family protein [Novipirellula artificiosorum]TWU37083.1 transcriptional activator RfaH [Novipirellula artificiosorum]
MPILPQEPDGLPENLLDLEQVLTQTWWLMYTKSRQEKLLMRQLREEGVWHYGPQIPQRKRSPAGRIRTSFVPLFSNYVFVTGQTDEARYKSICTGCIIKAAEITEVDDFIADMKQIRDLIDMGVPLTLESRLQPGQMVRIRSGSFAGYEGTVLRREGETRLLVAVRFMEQGVSVKLEDCQLELIGQ